MSDTYHNEWSSRVWLSSLAGRFSNTHNSQLVKPTLCFSCSPCRKIIAICVAIALVATIVVVVYLVTKKSDPSSGGPYKREAVATDTPQCSQIGKDILDANGSAVDAAIAAMFCLGVVSMHSSGIGGGGVMLVYNRSLQKASVIDFRETAPALAHKDMFKGNEKKAERGI